MTTVNQTLLLIISVWPPNFRAALPPRWGPTLQISTGCIQCPLCHQQRPSFKTKHLALHHQAVVFTDVLRILLILQFLVRLWHQTGCSGQFVFVDQGVKLPLPALSFTFSGARSITVMATHRETICSNLKLRKPKIRRCRASPPSAWSSPTSLNGTKINKPLHLIDLAWVGIQQTQSNKSNQIVFHRIWKVLSSTRVRTSATFAAAACDSHTNVTCRFGGA